jgi:D-3-phosphoglycerate dehydrogenase
LSKFRLLLLEPCVANTISVLKTEDFEVYDSLNELASADLIEGVFLKLNFRLNKPDLMKWKNLKYILTPTTGTDHIDLEYCVEKNIQVISLKNLPDITSHFTGTSEMALWLMLSLARRSFSAAQDVVNGKWDRNAFIGTSLRNRTIGILGLGRLGMQMASLCKSLGMQILSYDLLDKQMPGVKPVNSISELFEQSDVISIHVDDRRENEKLISRNLLAKAENLLIVNTSRGFVIDEPALIDSMKFGKITGFGADVLSFEQGGSNDWLQKNIIWNGMVEHSLNVILTPHIGGAVKNDIQAAELAVFHELSRRLTGGVK